MPIALTAVVRPSLCLRLLHAGFALLGLGVAAGLALQGNFPIAIPCAAASIYGLVFLAGKAKSHRLDISGIGRIRLAVYLQSGPQSMVPVELLAGTVCWPWLLLLRLRGQDGALTVLVVLPDSLAPGAFRPLALACRACAAKKL